MTHRTSSRTVSILAYGLTLTSAFAASIALATPAAPTASPVAASQSIVTENAKIDASAAPCKRAEVCSVTITVEAQGAYHVNKEYPHKFVGAEALKWAKKDFGKASGGYVESGEKKFTITATFTPDKAGKVDVKGKLKYAVCTASDCAPREADIGFALDVK